MVRHIQDLYTHVQNIASGLSVVAFVVFRFMVRHIQDLYTHIATEHC